MATQLISAMTALWSSAGTTYNAIKMNVTNTVSALGSKLINMQVGGVEKFTVHKSGFLATAGAIAPTIDDGAALGTLSDPVTSAAFRWSDAFFASGAVLNWNSGNYTVTHSAGLLTFSGSLTVSGTLNAAGFGSSGNSNPSANDAASLGVSGTAWSDLFLASGGVINWAASDVTITHSTNLLAFGGASSGYTFDAVVKPSSNDGAALGVSGTAWSDVFLATGAVINFGTANMLVTHSTGILTVGNGDLRVTIPGANSDSVVTLGASQTLTSKTLTSPTINGATLTGTISGGTFTGSSMTNPALTAPTISGPALTLSTSSSTSEGRISWDATNDAIQVGDGAATVTFHPTIVTETASTSGTSIDFTSIPSWVTEITVTFAGLSTNVSDSLFVQLGDSGGVETSGYTCQYIIWNTGALNSAGGLTNAFFVSSVSAASTCDGTATLRRGKASTNSWVCSADSISNSSNFVIQSIGAKSTSATLDRIRITTSTGTSTFDAGAITVSYR